MNYTLQKEIIKHIFDIMNIFPSKDMFRMPILENLLDKKYLLDKKLAFEDNNQTNIWGAHSKIDSLDFKIMIADLTEDNIPEFCILTQTNNMPPCGVRLALDEADNGTMMFSVDQNKWLPASILQAAKTLVGFVRLSEIYIQWNKLEDYAELHKYLLGFLTFIENENN